MFQCTLQVFAGSPSGIPVYTGSTSGIPVYTGPASVPQGKGWYQEQRLCVKWDGITSDTFPVCNGIKQGGILSPKLFNMYVDVLSQQLNKVMVGCCMNGKVINHLYYADDLVLLSPSAHGMQKLLNECEKYASQYGMKFNENKSVVLNFKGYKFKAKPSATLYLNGSIMKTET